METSTTSLKEKPVHEIRLGSIKAAIWKNSTEQGTRFNATFERIYKDGEQWKSTSSFGREDLLALAKVADHAHSWIHEQKQQGGEAGERKSSTEK